MQEQPLNKHSDTVFCFKFAEKMGPQLENTDGFSSLTNQTSLQINNSKEYFSSTLKHSFFSSLNSH